MTVRVAPAFAALASLACLAAPIAALAAEHVAPAPPASTRRTAPVGAHVANIIGSCSLDRSACVDYEGALGLDPKERCEEGKKLWRDQPCPTGRLVATCTRVEAAGFAHTRSYLPVTVEVARAACRAGDGNFQAKKP